MLTHPTLAETALRRFREATKTISLITICKQLGGVRHDRYTAGNGFAFGRKIIEFVFEDDSSLQISGQGKTHKVETFLP